jgi:outer membrane protein assembly factor BamB
LAASSSRLAVIVADGRFAWINADSGRIETTAFLWSGILQGESWGEVYVDGLGTIAVAAIREQSINPQTGLADSRARLAAYDSEGNERWSLPELGPQHFYSAALSSISVAVGKWPQGFEDNTLAAYELYTGEKLWEIGDPDSGYEQIVHDGNRLYVLLDNDTGGAVAALDLRTGEELWRWSDPQMPYPDRVALGEGSVYVLNVNRLLALDPASGAVQWAADLQAAPEAGFAARGGLVYLVPSPAAEMGFRPGLISLYANGGGLAWHALAGLLADPLALGDEALWTVVKDYDSGRVALSGLDPATGLEQVRMAVSDNPEVLYQIVASGRRVYVLGDSLLAYGY